MDLTFSGPTIDKSRKSISQMPSNSNKLDTERSNFPSGSGGGAERERERVGQHIHIIILAKVTSPIHHKSSIENASFFLSLLLRFPIGSKFKQINRVAERFEEKKHQFCNIKPKHEVDSPVSDNDSII